MTYQSLYRRFRPTCFKEIIGQEHLVKVLQNAIQEQRVGHAYLLSGPRGTGKTSSARILAKALNCDNLNDDGEPCCECDNCQAIEGKHSLFLHEIDAASHNSVNDIRELIANVAVGGIGRRKVYILDEVHMLSRAAANALLKTLEEPPEHVVFILATTDPQKVPDTIRSRTQHIELALVSADKLTSYLKDISKRAEITLTKEMIEYIVKSSSGSVRDALSALDTLITAGGIPEKQIYPNQLLNAIANKSLTEALSVINTASVEGYSLSHLTDEVMAKLRNAFLLSNAIELDYLSEKELKKAAELAEAMGKHILSLSLAAFSESISQISQDTNPRLALEIAIMHILMRAEHQTS